VLGIAVIITAIVLNVLSMTGCAPADEGPTLVSIAVTTPPTKTTYNIGDELDTTGMVVTATYDDGSTAVITSYTTDFDSTTAGTKTVTVTYGGFTATFTVTIFSPYIITFNNTLNPFTVTKDGTPTNYSTIQNAIDGIKTVAAGADCVIQFGDGTDTLDIGTDYVNFSNLTGGNWGAITLIGKITNNLSNSSYGTIYISSGPITVTSNADIANTDDGTFAKAVYNYGTLNITGGTITNTKGYTVYTYPMYSTGGVVNISGGTITTTSGYAVEVGGTTSSTASATLVNISGGTITATTGRAVSNTSVGIINITGGTISVTSYGSAVYNSTTGTINITGGTITASSSGYAVNNRSTGAINITGGTITGNRYPST